MASLDLLKLAQLDANGSQNAYLKTDSSSTVVVGNIDDIVKSTEDILTLTNTSATTEQDWTFAIGNGTQHPDSSFSIQTGNVANSVNTVFRALGASNLELATNITNLGTTTLDISGYPGGGTTTGTSIMLNHGGVSKGIAASTSGNLTVVEIAGGVNQSFEPTTGTATFTALEINQAINQTGGASGITRGIYINPTLTTAVDFRAIDVESGEVLINSSLKYIDGNQADGAVLISDTNGLASWNIVDLGSNIDFRYDSNLDTASTMFFRGLMSNIEFYPANEIDANNLTLDVKLDADLTWTNISSSVDTTTAASDLQTWVDANVTVIDLWRLRITVIYNVGETNESSILMKFIS